MEISEFGIGFICEHEGCRLVAYPDPAPGGDPWTVGFGSTTDVIPGQRITLGEAQDRLKKDLKHVETCINGAVTVPLTQNEYDALCSLVFNIGCGAFRKSTLLRMLNEERYEDAAMQFRRWDRAGGKVMDGLTKRRLKEQRLFESA